MPLNSNFHILSDTKEFVLGHIFEDAYLVDMRTEDCIYLGEFYGDPSCGFIAEDNSFCIVGGTDRFVMYRDKQIIEIKDLVPVFDLRQTSSSIIDILLDPWSEKPAVWELNVVTLEKNKLRDFLTYQDKEYTENIHW